MASSLPELTRRFIADHIHSVEQLEVLLLLHGAPEREWPLGEVSGRIHTQPDSVAARLEDLTERGFLERVERSGGVRYRYRAGERDREVAELADCYARRRVSVITEIFTPRDDAMRSFSDAFRLRGRG